MPYRQQTGGVNDNHLQKGLSDKSRTIKCTKSSKNGVFKQIQQLTMNKLFD